MKWAVPALGATQIIGYGTLYYAFPILVPDIARSFAASPTVLYGILSIGLVAGGIAAPFIGRMIDRLGAPLLMTCGSLAAAALLMLIAAAPSLMAFGVGVILTELVGVAILYDAAFAVLARLHGQAARRAITNLTLIAGFASTIFWPLTEALRGSIGWRQTYLLFATLHGTLAFGLHLALWRAAPAHRTASPFASASSKGTRQFPTLPPEESRAAFRLVALSFALSGVLTSAMGVHMVPVLTLAGLGAAATSVAMIMGPAQVAIRLTDALFWHALHPLTVAMIATCALPLALAGLILDGPAWLAGIAFAALLGVGGGLASIVRGTLPLVLFGPDGFGERLGRLAALRTVLSAFAPFAFGWLLVVLPLSAALGVLLIIGLAAAIALVALRLRLGRAGRLAPLD